MKRTMDLTVNGQRRTVKTEDGRPLLYVLREDLQLTGTKYGCGEGECGACTVLLDGQPTRSCMTAVELAEGKAIQTIEGLAPNGNLHPVQQAFVEESPMQCGFCTGGMILSAVELLGRKHNPSDDDITTAMNGHLCRCCSYPGYLAAIRRAAAISEEGRQL